MASKFGPRLCSARERRALTQAALAAKLNVSKQRVSELEQLDDPPKLATIQRLAKALGVKVSWLAGIK